MFVINVDAESEERSSVTENLRFKIDNCPDKRYYKSLKAGVDKLCHECYMKIVDSYQCQISTITRNIEVDNSIETDLIEINNLAETSESDISTNLSNLITTNEFTTSTNLNLIELIKAQKDELIKNNSIEINQQFTDIKININNNNNIVLMDKKNFDQLVKLIIQKDLKIE
ncbi:8686_t:CDS:2, partial [Dentiscutata erythropus]